MVTRTTATGSLNAGQLAWPLLSVGLFLTLSGVAPDSEPTPRIEVPSPARDVISVSLPEASSGANPGRLNAVPYAVSIPSRPLFLAPDGVVEADPQVCEEELWFGSLDSTEEQNSNNVKNTAPQERLAPLRPWAEIRSGEAESGESTGGSLRCGSM